MHQRNDSVPSGVKITAITYAAGQVTTEHCHRRGQLIYAVKGVMEITAQKKLWRIPPQRAVWIPPDTFHSMHAHGAVELRTLFTPPEMISRFSKTPLMIAVSPLLRELVLRGVSDQTSSPDEEVKRGIISLAISELELLMQESLQSPGYALRLPSGNDKRLVKICAEILNNPGHPYGLEEWAQKVFTSKRTLARRFQSEFGMSFLNWRQQVKVAAALSRLDQGEAVTIIASDLGYETPASFSLMFRKLTGLTPSSYASVTGAHA